MRSIWLPTAAFLSLVTLFAYVFWRCMSWPEERERRRMEEVRNRYGLLNR